MAESVESLEILVVDNHERFLNIVSEHLKKAGDGWKVTAVSDGLEALSLAPSLKPQIAILDLNMPVSGLHIARYLQSRLPETKIIILTLYDSEIYREIAREAGVDEYISKADCFSELIPAVKRLAASVDCEN